MKASVIILCLFALLLLGCKSNDDSNISPLVGTWVTEFCEQASDSNGSLVTIWLKGLFEFTSQGTIRLGNEQYADSNCTTLSNSLNLSEADIPITFKDLGTQLLQEGINGGGLLIEMGSGSQSLSVEAFYTISNNILCFSDAFTFEALGFGVSETRSVAIDFDNCLTEYEQP